MGEDDDAELVRHLRQSAQGYALSYIKILKRVYREGTSELQKIKNTSENELPVPHNEPVLSYYRQAIRSVRHFQHTRSNMKNNPETVVFLSLKSSSCLSGPLRFSSCRS